MPPNVAFGTPSVELQAHQPRRGHKRWFVATVLMAVLMIVGFTVGIQVAATESTDLAADRIQSAVLPMTDDGGGNEADEADSDQPVRDLVVSTTSSTAPPPTVAATTASEETTTIPGCHPAYVECLPNRPGDPPDCDDLRDSFDHVHLVDPDWDPYELDDNGDGMGC